MIFSLARSVLKDTFEAMDSHAPSLEVGGQTDRKTTVTTGLAMTLFGPVVVQRSWYRPSKMDTSLFPTEVILRLTAGGLTPAAAGLSMFLMSSLTARESVEAVPQRRSSYGLHQFCSVIIASVLKHFLANGILKCSV